MILGIAVLLAGLGGVAVRQWWHDRPPYGPEALSARATLRIVDQATANAAFKPSGADFAAATATRYSWVRSPGTGRRARRRAVPSGSFCSTSAAISCPATSP
nr:hypothetical protein GCM10020092_060510 [Actinoplanes digitatis]